MDTAASPERVGIDSRDLGISAARISDDLFSATFVQSIDEAGPIATARQLEVLRFIHEHIGRVGYAPTFREIGARLRIRSTNGTRDHLAALVRKGLLVRGRHAARGLAVTQAGLEALAVVVHDAPVGSSQPPRPRAGAPWMHGVVYFIEAVGCARVKIGFTKGPVEDRRDVLQVCAPFPLKVVASFVGTQQDEAGLHQRFASLRVCGEWFRIGPDLVAFLASCGVLAVGSGGVAP